MGEAYGERAVNFLWLAHGVCACILGTQSQYICRRDNCFKLSNTSNSHKCRDKCTPWRQSAGFRGVFSSDMLGTLWLHTSNADVIRADLCLQKFGPERAPAVKLTNFPSRTFQTVAFIHSNQRCFQESPEISRYLLANVLIWERRKHYTRNSFRLYNSWPSRSISLQLRSRTLHIQVGTNRSGWAGADGEMCVGENTVLETMWGPLLRTLSRHKLLQHFRTFAHGPVYGTLRRMGGNRYIHMDCQHSCVLWVKARTAACVFSNFLRVGLNQF